MTVDNCLEMVRMALERRNAAEAHAAIDLMCEQKPINRVTLDSPVADMGFEDRIINTLENAGVMTVRDLCEETTWSLGKLSTFGPDRVHKIEAIVEQHGYRLREPMRAVQSA